MISSFQLLEENIPVSTLAEKLKYSPLWKDFTARQMTPGSAHKYTESILVKCPKEATVEAWFNDLETVDYRAVDEFPEIDKMLFLFQQSVNYTKLGRVMIVNLAPGGYIDPHIDEGAYADYYQRFHISLQSDYGNLFYSGHSSIHGEFVHMAPGTMYWFNHKREHWLSNNSQRARYHLIVDAVTPIQFGKGL